VNLDSHNKHSYEVVNYLGFFSLKIKIKRAFSGITEKEAGENLQMKSVNYFEDTCQTLP